VLLAVAVVVELVLQELMDHHEMVAMVAMD